MAEASSSHARSVQALITWATIYNPDAFYSEDDVETKCILPLFSLLGYPESHRRGKYPLPDPTKRGVGRNPEADYVYFSTAESTAQGVGTALILIEAKKPDVTNLQNAHRQAQQYNVSLRAFLTVVTNGRELQVRKRQLYSEDEVIWDQPLTELRNLTEAQKFYELLNFDTVHHAQSQALDPLTHARHITVDRALQQNPELQELLQVGDFPSTHNQTDTSLLISTAKVMIECELPLGLTAGQCWISFSNPLLRRLTIHIPHREMLNTFIHGMGTPIEWQARSFLRFEGQDTVTASLGEAILTLSHQEAAELAQCIDAVMQPYRAALLKTEQVLDATGFPYCHINHQQGFPLLSIVRWVWNIIRAFMSRHDWEQGTSRWHVFDGSALEIRVGRNHSDNAYIYPVFPQHAALTNADIDLVYILPPGTHSAYGVNVDWAQRVGPIGVWTVSATHRWLLSDFFPYLQTYASKHFKHAVGDWKDAITKDYATVPSFPSSLATTNMLPPLLMQIHERFSHYGDEAIAVAPLRSYMRIFQKLAKAAIPTTVDVYYLAGKLGGATAWLPDEPSPRAEPSSEPTYASVMHLLDRIVADLEQREYLSAREFAYITSAFYVLTEKATIPCNQITLNEVLACMHHLWADTQFENRYQDARFYW